LRKSSPDYVEQIKSPIQHMQLLDPYKGNRIVALSSFRYTYYSVRDNISGAHTKYPWNLTEYRNLNLTIFPRYIGTDKKSMMFKFRNYTNAVKFSKDNVFSFPLGICFRNNDVLYKKFRTLIQRLIEAGITSTFEDQSISQEEQYYEMFKILDKGKETALLSIEMLEAGFVIWLISLLFALITFISEFIYYGFTIFLKNLKKKSEIIKVKLKKRKERKKFERSLEGIASKERLNFDKRRAKEKKSLRKNIAKMMKQNDACIVFVEPLN
jgi:hypothetical protein